MSAPAPNKDPSPAQPLLDHIVILVDSHTLTDIDARLSGLFTVAPGGRHAGGLTWNRLILFPDGVYIELIAFLDTADPETRRRHRWGALPDGTVVDWACSLRGGEQGFGQVQARVRETQTGYAYDDPVPGGRETPDGTVLRWAIGAARGPDGQATEPGTLPFWCLDRTPRRLRVPFEDSTETRHACGARGVARVVLEGPDGGDVERLGCVYEAIFGSSSVAGDESNKWHFDVPSGSQNGKQTISITSSSAGQVTRIVLAGDHRSPSFVELLPGLTLKIEA